MSPRILSGSPYSSLAQSVEHAAVNRRVVCSSQTGGARRSGRHPRWRPTFFKSVWAFSSVGQSGRLITGWSGVRVPEGPPRQTKRAPFRFRPAAKTLYPLVPSSFFDQNPLRWAFDREAAGKTKTRKGIYRSWFIPYRGIAQLVERRSPKP